MAPGPVSGLKADPQKFVIGTGEQRDCTADGGGEAALCTHIYGWRSCRGLLLRKLKATWPVTTRKPGTPAGCPTGPRGPGVGTRCCPRRSDKAGSFPQVVLVCSPSTSCCAFPFWFKQAMDRSETGEPMGLKSGSPDFPGKFLRKVISLTSFFMDSVRGVSQVTLGSLWEMDARGDFQGGSITLLLWKRLMAECPEVSGPPTPRHWTQRLSQAPQADCLRRVLKRHL